MSMNASIEERLLAVERAIAELQQRLGPGECTPPANWLERFTGSFKDEPAFKEVIEYGRAFRMEDRPQENQEP